MQRSPIVKGRFQRMGAMKQQGLRQQVHERQGQPVTAPIGNYRIGPSGRPLLPSHREQMGQFTRQQIMRRNSSAYQKQEFPRRSQQVYYDRSLHPSRSHNYRRDYANDYQRSLGDHHTPYWRNQVNHRLDHWVQSPQKKLIFDGLPSGKWKFFLIYLIIYAVMIWSGFQILPYNKVNTVRVIGNELVREESVLSGLKFNPMDRSENVLKWRKEIEEHILEQTPLLKDVRISRDHWQAIDIVVEEHQIVGRMKNQRGVFAMFSNGNYSENDLVEQKLSQKMVDQLPLVTGDFNDAELEQVGKALSQVEPTVLSLIDQVSPSSETKKSGYLTVTMKDGNLVKAVSSTFAQKINYYPQMVNQLQGQIGIIDLEVGAYFTPSQDTANSVKLDDN